MAVVVAAAQHIEPAENGAGVCSLNVDAAIGPLILAGWARNLPCDFEWRRHVFVIIEPPDVELIGGSQGNPGPDAVLARLQTIVEAGDEIPGRGQVEPMPAEVAAPIGRNSVPLPDAGAIDEPESRKIIPAQLLDARLQAERFIGQI